MDGRTTIVSLDAIYRYSLLRKSFNLKRNENKRKWETRKLEQKRRIEAAWNEKKERREVKVCK